MCTCPYIYTHIDIQLCDTNVFWAPEIKWFCFCPTMRKLTLGDFGIVFAPVRDLQNWCLYLCAPVRELKQIYWHFCWSNFPKNIEFKIDFGIDSLCPKNRKINFGIVLLLSENSKIHFGIVMFVSEKAKIDNGFALLLSENSENELGNVSTYGRQLKM